MTYTVRHLTVQHLSSSSTRMIIAGGGDSPGYTAVNNIDYITISTIGDALDFGDLSMVWEVLSCQIQ